MSEQALPPPLVSAFDALSQSGLVAIRGPLERDQLGRGVFRFDIGVPQPNAEGLPPTVGLECRIHPGYPFGKIVFVPVDSTLEGFPHQSSSPLDGELCLLLSQDAYGWDPTTRLLEYVRAAVAWVADAAAGSLLQNGQPWELPDFRTGKARPKVLFSESQSSLSTWAPHVGHTGEAILARHANRRHLVVRRFDRDGKELFAPPYSPTFTRPEAGVAQWLMLSGIIVVRHRPPRTFLELADLCRRDSVDLWGAVRRASKKGVLDSHSFLLVGFPIPQTVGGASHEVHWQPIAIPDKEVQAALDIRVLPNDRGGNDVARTRLEVALTGRDIPWASAVNVGGTRLETRGVLVEKARSKRICILGCGALGSTMAESLARGGIRDLTLFDDETLEFENLTRHTLAPSDAGSDKALALSERLNGIHPRAQVRGFSVRLPVADDHPRATDLKQADIIIDCSANEAVFRWASDLGRHGGPRVAHLFTNARARMLTVCCSGAHASCRLVASRLFKDIRDGAAPFTMEEYDASGQDIEQGAGCWKATFPATGHDLSALVASAVPVIESMISGPSRSKGTAIVMRRNDFTQSSCPGPVVELLFSREYR